MTLEEYEHIYFDNKTINLKKAFSQTELKTINKLEVEIEDRFYTVHEYTELKRNLGIFFNINKDKELKYLKPLKYKVCKSDFNQLCKKIDEIDNKYEDLLRDFRGRIDFKDMWFSEKVHIRDKLINMLNEEKIDNNQNKELLKIVMDIENVKLVTKQRFILYYGLDGNKKKIHNCCEIARLEGCSASNIRQSVNQIKSKLLRLSDEKIDVLRKIVNKQ